MFRRSKDSKDNLDLAFQSVSTLQEVKGLEKLGYKPTFSDLFLTENMKTMSGKDEDALIYLLKKYFNPKLDSNYQEHKPYLIELFKEASIKNMPLLAKTLLDFDIISDKELRNIASQVRDPEMIHLFHDAGVDYNKENLGKKIIDIELSLFIFFANRDMLNKDRLATVNTLLDCGVKVTEEELPVLKEWDDNLLPRIRDEFISRLNKIKKQLEDNKPELDVQPERQPRSITDTRVGTLFEEKKDKDHKRSQTLQVPTHHGRRPGHQ